MIPALVLSRKAKNRFPAKRNAGCLSEASSCVSDGEQFVAASKRKPAVFLFVTFSFGRPKEKVKAIIYHQSKVANKNGFIKEKKLTQKFFSSEKLTLSEILSTFEKLKIKESC